MYSNNDYDDHDQMQKGEGVASAGADDAGGGGFTNLASAKPSTGVLTLKSTCLCTLCAFVEYQKSIPHPTEH